METRLPSACSPGLWKTALPIWCCVRVVPQGMSMLSQIGHPIQHQRDALNTSKQCTDLVLPSCSRRVSIEIAPSLHCVRPGGARWANARNCDPLHHALQAPIAALVGCTPCSCWLPNITLPFDTMYRALHEAMAHKHPCMHGMDIPARPSMHVDMHGKVDTVVSRFGCTQAHAA